jgi:hypothetical protein
LTRKHVLITLLLIPTIFLFMTGALLFVVTPTLGMESRIPIPNSYLTQVTSDGGFILAGSTGSYDIWLQKLDVNGNTQWSKVYPDANYTVPFSIDQTTDGGYFISGWTFNVSATPLDYQLLLIKVDSYGNEVWNKTYVTGDYVSYVVQHTADGGCVLGGGTVLSVFKLDTNGSEQWNRTYSCPGFYSRAIRQTSDGGYVFLTALFDTCILRTNSSGYPEWTTTFPYGLNVFPYVQQTADGGFLISGTADISELGSSPGHAILIKLFSNGSTQWVNEFGVTGSSGGNALKTSDGGYAMAVFLPWWFLGGRAGIWKIDANGVTQWSRPLDINSPASLVRQRPDGGYVLLAASRLVQVSGSPPSISVDAISAIYFASWLMIFVTSFVSAGAALLSLNMRMRVAFGLGAVAIMLGSLFVPTVGIILGAVAIAFGASSVGQIGEDKGGGITLGLVALVLLVIAWVVLTTIIFPIP